MVQLGPIGTVGTDGKSPTVRPVDLPQLSYETAVDAIEREGGQLIKTATGRFNLPVPSCPGWDVAQLVTHVGHIHDWAARNLAAPPDERVRMGRPALGGVETGRAALTRLVEILRAGNPHILRAGPLQPRTAAWWARRQLLETVVHRWDLENAVATPAGIDPVVAATGVTEFLEVFAGGSGPVTLRAADLDLTWSAPPDAAAPPVIVTASAADLLLLLWGRLGTAAVRVEGDPATYGAWRSTIAT